MSGTDAQLELRFQSAAEKARVTNNVKSDDKLKLYGLFKQATEGPIGDRTRPGFFDQVGRAKHDAWAALGNTPKDEAKEQYIALVDSL